MDLGTTALRLVMQAQDIYDELSPPLPQGSGHAILLSDQLKIIKDETRMLTVRVEGVLTAYGSDAYVEKFQVSDFHATVWACAIRLTENSSHH